MDMELKDKVAVVTGGSVGIGLAVAQGLAEGGVHLVLCARDEARLQSATQQIATTSGVQADWRAGRCVEERRYRTDSAMR